MLPLLRPAARRRARSEGDCIDLLGGELPSTGRVQDLMRSRVVPQIYERWWRPGLGRVLKGVFGPSMADEHRIAHLLLTFARGDGVLDVACGPGNFSREFARVVGDTGLVVGIDASLTMVRRAAQDSRNADVDNLVFVRGDAVDLPFKKQSFDAVCCFAALHLFADPFKALDSMRRVLTPGGRIAIFTTCHGRSGPMRTFETLAGRSGGMRMFEHDEIVDALEKRGFDGIRQRVAGFTQFVGGRLA